MQQAVSIVGFKNSGKTTWTGLLADALERQGKRVAIAKFSHCKLDKADTDTARHSKAGRTTVGLSANESAIFWSEPTPLSALLPLINADILLVEGGKQLSYMPRIACLRDAAELAQLQSPTHNECKPPSLLIASTGQGSQSTANIPHFAEANPENADALAQLVLKEAFLLPDINCGACGYPDCASLGAAIISNNATRKDCKSLDSPISIRVGNQEIAAGSFVSKILRSTLEGMLSELKGYSKGAEVHINFK